MLVTPSFKKSLIVEQFQGNCLKLLPLLNILPVGTDFILLLLIINLAQLNDENMQKAEI